MTTAVEHPIRAAEADRLAALREYEILDTPPEQAFDDLTLLASRICATPIALVTLVDAERQWFKSRVGIEASGTPREISFCSHAIQQRGVTIVPDATKDQGKGAAAAPAAPAKK